MREYNGIININESENDYCLYKMYSSDKKDFNIYIGVTRNHKQRVYKHSIDRKRKSYDHKPLYIWLNDVIDNKKIKVIFEIIEKGLSEKEAFEKEIEYIEHYKTLNYNLLNISKGGKGNKGQVPWNKGKFYTKELKIKLSNSHLGKIGGMKGKKHSEKTKELISLRNKERKDKNWINPKSKKVYKYNSDNILIAVYNSLQDAAKFENVSPTSVGEWCRKEKQPRNKFFYSYIKLEY